MRALLDDTAAVHDKDIIRIPDSGQPVRDNEAGLSLHEVSHRGLDLLFRSGIDV